MSDNNKKGEERRKKMLSSTLFKNVKVFLIRNDRLAFCSSLLTSRIASVLKLWAGFEIVDSV